MVRSTTPPAPAEELYPLAWRNGRTLLLGTAQILVQGADALYHAPDLIYHYVTRHHYRPPGGFVEAVMVTPLPGSVEYESQLAQTVLDDDDELDFRWRVLNEVRAGTAWWGEEYSAYRMRTGSPPEGAASTGGSTSGAGG